MIGYAVSLFCGLLLMTGVFGSGFVKRQLVLMIALASSTGLILTSASMWFMMLLTDKSSVTLLVVSDLICVTSCVIFWFLCRRDRAGDRSQHRTNQQASDVLPQTIPLKKHSALWCNVVAATIMTIYALLGSMIILVRPLGAWDAWTIWNLRARFLSSEVWRHAFDQTMSTSHLDYPLAHPLSIARLWLYDSVTFGISDLSPQFIAIHWMLVILAVIWAAARQLRGTFVATMTALLFVCLSLPAQMTSSQYADLPLAAMMLITLSSVALAIESKQKGWWFLAGLGLAGAMWTKNEGLVFAATCMLALVIRSLLGGRSASWRWLGVMLAGCLPVGLAWLSFKLCFTFPNDLVQTDRFSDMISQAASPARHWAVLKELFREFSPWHLGPVLLLPLAWLLVPGKRSEVGLVLLLCMAGYLSGLYGAYLITPHDLPWHVKTSATRLACQAWPSLVLLAALWRAAPTKNQALPETI